MKYRVEPLASKSEKLVIGLMSGTSCDGIDASLVKIRGSYKDTKVEEIAFITIPYEESVRAELLEVVKGSSGGSKRLMELSFLLGDLFLEAALKVCEKAAIDKTQVDLIGSHGHTVFHQPIAEEYLGHMVRGTMQLGDVSKLAATFKCPVVSDFRTRDFAEGGMGAPLVPYSEFILFSDKNKNVAYQNIGGIGNISLLKKDGDQNEIIAFDTGPGNVLLDALISYYSNGKLRYDEDGSLASKGELNEQLKNFFLQDEYLQKRAPKTTGREYYNSAYVDKIIKKAQSEKIKVEDVLYTTCYFTAYSIKKGLLDFPSFKVDKLVVAGGGCHNKTLMTIISSLLPDVEVKTADEEGFNSDSKEAVAFAVLANETISGNENCLTGATGAKRPSVLGKIQF